MSKNAPKTEAKHNKDQEKQPHHHHHHHQEKGVQEVTRKSLLDVLKENMKIAQRTTYLHRLIYIGDHTFPLSEETGIQAVYENVVELINEKHCDEKLTGYILCYHRYFCVVIDGDEEVLVRHLKILLQQDSKDPGGPKFGRLKLLVAYHHANQRLLKDWTHTSGKPPTLLEKLNPDADLSQTMSKVTYVIEKLYNLGLALRSADDRQTEDGADPSDDAGRSFEAGLQFVSKSTIKDVASSSSRKVGSSGPSDNLLPPSKTKSSLQYLPEVSVLEFLLASPYTIELRNYPKVYGKIPYLDSYQDMVWPVGTDFTPMNLQAEDIDPITDLDPEVIPK